MSKEILTREEYKAWKAGGPAASEKQAGATIEALATYARAADPVIMNNGKFPDGHHYDWWETQRHLLKQKGWLVDD